MQSYNTNEPVSIIARMHLSEEQIDAIHQRKNPSLVIHAFLKLDQAGIALTDDIIELVTIDDPSAIVESLIILNEADRDTRYAMEFNILRKGNDDQLAGLLDSDNNVDPIKQFEINIKKNQEKLKLISTTDDARLFYFKIFQQHRMLTQFAFDAIMALDAKATIIDSSEMKTILNYFRMNRTRRNFIKDVIAVIIRLTDDQVKELIKIINSNNYDEVKVYLDERKPKQKISKEEATPTPTPQEPLPTVEPQNNSLTASQPEPTTFALMDEAKTPEEISAKSLPVKAEVIQDLPHKNQRRSDYSTSDIIFAGSIFGFYQEIKNYMNPSIDSNDKDKAVNSFGIFNILITIAIVPSLVIVNSVFTLFSQVASQRKKKYDDSLQHSDIETAETDSDSEKSPDFTRR